MNDVLPPETVVPAVGTPTRRQIEENLRNFARAPAGALTDNTARAPKADTAIFTGWCTEQGRDGSGPMGSSKPVFSESV